MEIHIRCSACKAALSVGQDLEGTTVACPRCGARLEIRAEQRRPAGPAAAAGRSELPMVEPQQRKESDLVKMAPEKAQTAAQETSTRIAGEWDLPAASAPDPRRALQDQKKRRVRVVSVVAIVVLVMGVSLALAVMNKRPRMRFEPPAAMHPLNQDVGVGHWRFRVTGVEWRRQPAEAGGEAGPQLLDVALSVTNLDNSPRAIPLVRLGSRSGKDLGAEFGTPVLKGADGRPLTVLQPDQTVQGHVVFQPRFDEYCLIVSGNSGTGADETALISLTPKAVEPGH
jgi:DNA-directed RNA polymerase subunit RPC12/RpoP